MRRRLPAGRADVYRRRLQLRRADRRRRARAIPTRCSASSTPIAPAASAALAALAAAAGEQRVLRHPRADGAAVAAHLQGADALLQDRRRVPRLPQRPAGPFRHGRRAGERALAACTSPSSSGWPTRRGCCAIRSWRRRGCAASWPSTALPDTVEIKARATQARPHHQGGDNMRLMALVVAGVLASAGLATAQEWKPDRPITLIVPWAAGGSTDQVTRVAAAEIETALGGDGGGGEPAGGVGVDRHEERARGRRRRHDVDGGRGAGSRDLQGDGHARHLHRGLAPLSRRRERGRGRRQCRLRRGRTSASSSRR